MSMAELLDHWSKECTRNGHLQFAACQSYARRRAWLTILNMFASIMTLYMSSSEKFRNVLDSTMQSIGHSMSFHPGLTAEILTGFVAAVVVASGAIQYLLRYDERHIEHRLASGEYYNMARKIDRIRITGNITPDIVHSLSKEMNAALKCSPAVSQRFWKAANLIQGKKPEASPALA